jgi:hypothetical protein
VSLPPAELGRSSKGIVTDGDIFHGDGSRLTASSRVITLGVSLLSARENRKGLLAANEPHCLAPLEEPLPDESDSDTPVFLGGGTRPNSRFRQLYGLAGVSPERDIEPTAAFIVQDAR